jgi:hypothetical protein
VIGKLSLSLTYIWAAIMVASVFVSGIGILMIFIVLLPVVRLFQFTERLRGGE